MIRRVKQKIRNCLTEKYDAEYFQKLEEQVTSYDDWIWEQENSSKNQNEVIVWDLEKEKRQKLEKRKNILLISYSELSSILKLQELLENSMEKIVILAENVGRITGNAIDEIVEVFEEKEEIEILYGDEEEVNHNENIRMNPWFKPDYSPDTLLSYFYFGKLVAVRKDTLKMAVESLGKKQGLSDVLTVKDDISFDAENEVSDYLLKAGRILYAVILEICSKLNRDCIFHLKKVIYSSHNIQYWGYEE